MSTKRKLNVFDVIGPVMIGPSSSHTAGAARLGKLARLLLAEEPQSARFTLFGSLAATYRGHGTDLALIGGVLGYNPDDERIRNSREQAEQAKVEIEFVLKPEASGLIHPNMAQIELSGTSRQVKIVGASVGGGKVEILELNGFQVHLKGEEYTLVINSWDQPGVITRLSGVLAEAGVNIGNMDVARQGKGKAVVMTIELDVPLSKDTVDELYRIPGVNKCILLDKI